jgi:hypothetical protein
MMEIQAIVCEFNLKCTKQVVVCHADTTPTKTTATNTDSDNDEFQDIHNNIIVEHILPNSHTCMLYHRRKRIARDDCDNEAHQTNTAIEATQSGIHDPSDGACTTAFSS